MAGHQFKGLAMSSEFLGTVYRYPQYAHLYHKYYSGKFYFELANSIFNLLCSTIEAAETAGYLDKKQHDYAKSTWERNADPDLFEAYFSALYVELAERGLQIAYSLPGEPAGKTPEIERAPVIEEITALENALERMPKPAPEMSSAKAVCNGSKCRQMSLFA